MITQKPDCDLEFRGAAYALDLKRLIELKPRISSINSQGSESKKSAMHHAIINDGKGNVIEWLKENGADANLPDKNGNTPFHLACKNRNSVAFFALITIRPKSEQAAKSMAEKPLAVSNLNPLCKNNEGETPLSYFSQWIGGGEFNKGEKEFMVSLMTSCLEQKGYPSPFKIIEIDWLEKQNISTMNSSTRGKP